jgi:Spy/CpxP family protein refolding chaperone
MNRTIRTGIASLALAGAVGALALVPARVAFAEDAGAAQGEHHHHGHQGLLGAALKLDSLTADQRSSVEQLIQQRRTASAPVRQADSQVLQVLAHQVEQASINPQGLAPTLNIEKGAVATETAVERDALNRLHGILTPVQRGQLVDAIEAHFHGGHQHADAGTGGPGTGWQGGGHGLDLTAQQRAQIRANLQAEGPTGQGAHMRAMLEAFRGDTFDATGFVTPVGPGERAERFAEAAVPVLSPTQRATFANHLRARAAHESGS